MPTDPLFHFVLGAPMILGAASKLFEQARFLRGAGAVPAVVLARPWLLGNPEVEVIRPAGATSRAMLHWAPFCVARGAQVRVMFDPCQPAFVLPLGAWRTPAFIIVFGAWFVAMGFL